MKIKRHIRNMLLFALWTVLGAGVLVLLVAAMDIKNHKACKNVEIVISGVEDFYFLDQKDIERIISDAGVRKPKGKPIAAFDLLRLEAQLERNVWVKDAELFFDNNLVLHVNIMEREPVARMFTTSGNSFYIDSSGFRMPLSDKMTVRLPVFTGFPSYRIALHSQDSLLMAYIKTMSRYIYHDEFWMAQIAQVDITPDRRFTLVPTLGNHVIRFGDGENYESKFRRLFVFYRQVLSQAGLDKYSAIDVQYDRQVIGTKKGPVPKIDSLKTLKNIQNMIRETLKITEDSVFTPAESYDAGWSKTDSLRNLAADSAAKPEMKAAKPEVKAVKPAPAKAAPPKPAPVKIKPAGAKPPAVHIKKAAPPVKKPVAVPKKMNRVQSTQQKTVQQKPVQRASGAAQKPKAVMGKPGQQ